MSNQNSSNMEGSGGASLEENKAHDQSTKSHDLENGAKSADPESTQPSSVPDRDVTVTEHSETNQSHEKSPPPQGPSSQGEKDSLGSEIKVEDVVLREKSPGSEGSPRPHPLSVDTSDSEASLGRYSPKLYTSGIAINVTLIVYTCVCRVTAQHCMYAVV